MFSFICKIYITRIKAEKRLGIICKEGEWWDGGKVKWRWSGELWSVELFTCRNIIINPVILCQEYVSNILPTKSKVG